MKSVRLSGWLAILGLFPSAPARAADAGWGGGVEVTAEAAASLAGGERRGTALHALGLAHLDWEQVAASGGALRWRAYAGVLALEGRGPTERFLGDFLAASNMEGYNSVRLYSWWLEAQADGWSLRGGALLADEEFAGTEAGASFFNSVFGWPAFISANTVNTGPAFFVAAPGLRLERHVGDAAIWRLGVYDGDTFDSAAGNPTVNPHGWHYRLGGAQGWFAISEVACAPAASPARFRAGVWLHTADFADVRDDAAGRPFAITGAVPRSHSSNYGVYAIGECTLAGKAGEAGYTAAFLRAGLAPSDRNTLGWVLDAGVAGTGLLPGRPADVAALGLAHAAFSPRLAANARVADPGQPAPDYEQVIEANYTVALNGHLTLIPDVQYVRHPGGSAAVRDAVVFFLRMKAAY